MRERGVLVLLVVAVLLPALSGAAAPDPGHRAEVALRQMEAAAGSPLLVTRSSVSGFVSFVRTSKSSRGIPMEGASAEARALAFLEAYAPAFGLGGDAGASVVSTSSADAVGMQHVRLQQTYRGIPVTGAELVVHLRASSVVAASAKVVAVAPEEGSLSQGTASTRGQDVKDGSGGPNVVPRLEPAEAARVVRSLLRERLGIADVTLSEPRLQVFSRGLFESWRSPAVLAWFVEARRADRREFVWVDAQRGGILLHFDQMPRGRHRSVYDANSGSILPGTVLRVEGGADTGDGDVDLAYLYAGDTYDYFWSQHGRDSYDGAGAELRSSVRYCPNPSGCPYDNAFWNGSQMVYGEGIAAADDVVAHELTHAVTEHSADLFYYMQSGALNESFSDVFGESVDLTNGHGNDGVSVRWLIGEDGPGGAVRNMMNPAALGDPGRVSDSARFYCGREDDGGVHTNSGVLNHSYALLADGGTYNGHAVTGIGLAKAGSIYYRALNHYLVSASDFADADAALRQSCADLVGTSGITAGDCSQLGEALDAVELAFPWPCTPAQPTVPALCGAGQQAQPIWTDDFENVSSGRWARAIVSGTTDHWGGGDGDDGLYWSGFATSGSRLLWGFNEAVVGDSAVGMTSGVVLPAAARLQFNHAYDIAFEMGADTDGGVLEYSVDGGGSWLDAGSLISAGATYNATLDSDNPLAGRQALTNLSYGYTASQLDLSSLAGQSFRLRFRMGTDSSTGYVGWVIDDVRIYTCSATSQTLTVSMVGTGGGTVVSQPAGIACGTDCSEAYGQNTAITLQAVPDPGSSFAGWSGGCAGLAATCQVTMDAAKSVTAAFDIPASFETLSVTKTGAGAGTVVSSPPGIDCGSQCEADFGTGSVVTLTAVPDAPEAGVFDGWSGAGCAGTGPCAVTMDAAKSVTASFSLAPQTVVVTVAGNGSGTVSSSPAGISCGTSCSASYAFDTPITLTATAAAGSKFAGWVGACSGTASECPLSTTSYRWAMAIFVSGNVLYDNGPRRSCSGCGSGGADASVLAAGWNPFGFDHSVTSGHRGADDFPVPDGERWTVESLQLFAYQADAPLGTSPLTGVNLRIWDGQPGAGGTSVFGDTTTNRLTSSTFSGIYRVPAATLGNTARAVWLDTATVGTTLDSGTYWLDWQTGGSASYTGPWIPPVVVSGQGTTGNAIAFDGVAWAPLSLTGAGGGPVGLPFLVIGSRSFRLTVSKEGIGTGGVSSAPAGIDCGASCSTFFEEDEVVTLTAVATGGSTFEGWSGAGCSGTGSCVVTMDAVKSVTASFDPPCPYEIDPTEASLTAAGGAATISVSAVPGCGWTAVSNDPAWLTVTSGSPGSGDGSVGYSAAANSAGARTGTITIGVQTFTVEQAAAPCVFSLDPSSAGWDAFGGAGAVDVSVGGWCDWTAVSDSPAWLTVSSGTPGTGNGSVGYSVAANSAGVRSGTIAIGDQSFTVTQAPLSDRELSHGSAEWQSLVSVGGVVHVDYYRLAQEPYSSYEAVVDGTSADLQPLQLDRLDADNTTVLASSQAVGVGVAQSLRWRNGLSTPVTSQSLRVVSGGCDTDCGDDDTYRIRFYETTAWIPRFNNSASQRTVLILQNPADDAVSGSIYFWDGTGTQLASTDFTLGAKETLVQGTAALPALLGASGTITIAHDGRYGALAGKAVALEPATGYSFDSPMLWRSLR